MRYREPSLPDPSNAPRHALTRLRPAGLSAFRGRQAGRGGALPAGAPACRNWQILSLARFFLAFVVLNGHLGWFEPSPFSEFMKTFGGKAAVIGFLVLSGFSVATSYDRAPGNFLVRRAIRIYPAYVVAILFAVALQTVLGPYAGNGIEFTPATPAQIVGNLLLLQEYLCDRLGFDPVVWSLSIEFSFYVLLWIIGRRGNGLWIALFAVSIVHFVLPRSLSDAALYRDILGLNMVRYLWPFILGVWLSRSGWNGWTTCAAAAGALGILKSGQTPEALCLVTYCGTLAAIALAQRIRPWAHPAHDFLGDLCYPLYLIHAPTMIWCVAILGISDPWIVTTLSLALSVGIVILVERPMSSLMRRLVFARPGVRLDPT